MKTCSKCRETKPLEDFGKNKSRPDGKNPWCKVCNSASAKRYYHKNPERMKERRREWYQDNIERERAKAKDRYWADPEASREKNKKWKSENSEKVKAYQREYVRSNLDAFRCYNQNRRARLEGNGGSHTAEQWQLLCESFGNVCLCCKEEKPLTVDHVVPISKGGTNDIWNLQPLCRGCNSSRGTQIIDYRQEIEL